MNRRKFLVLVTAFSLAGTMPAWADKQDDIIERLVEAGFSQIEVTRTLLGRIRIVAIKGNIRRELVINPRTGESLRDVTVVAEGGTASHGSSSSNGGSSEGPGSDADVGGDDNGDDDSDDHDDDDDSSGSDDDDSDDD